MFSIIWSGVLALLRMLLGVKSEPTLADKSADAARAETQLAEEHAANDVLTQGAAARADADARVLRGHASGPANGVNLDPAAAVNTSPDAHFRD